MTLYLSRFSYTPETWARLIRNPDDRRKAAQLYIESVGGKLHGFWYAFGTHDGYNLWEAPDNLSMAAVALVPPSALARSLRAPLERRGQTPLEPCCRRGRQSQGGWVVLWLVCGTECTHPPPGSGGAAAADGGLARPAMMRTSEPHG